MLPIKNPGSGVYTENVNVLVTLGLFIYLFVHLGNVFQLCLTVWGWKHAVYLFVP